MNKCYNGGINYLKESSFYTDCYGYDFKSFYPSILADKKLNFKIPIKNGYKFFFNNIEEIKKLYKTKKLNFGYYHVIVKCSHPDILKVFCFSKNNVYTNFDLEFIFKYNNLYKISFDLIDDEYNAYIYNNNDLIKSSEIFEIWYNNYKIFKDNLPKNKIIKHLASSLWGSLTAYKREYINKQQLFDREKNMKLGKKQIIQKNIILKNMEMNIK